ncbi:homeobox and leucine zipper encoding b [Poecilia formosa]|uniref:homeobox and leucine zipper encoding b n=1 Tax=Poecilia formosa TaxID=48698 RepID=UPI0004438310|nr:PREDICTED: homeobox and leucine zipper protein Homez-like [Poecilia formosa]XP_016532672.1 PREDICTED: homeobox and leucine zipper protein Homez-like [Poecilia formosa]XP_016532673.1 PREDICTED: homeobox and leucine zipper protein Homez-like [Poecilia formosa]
MRQLADRTNIKPIQTPSSLEGSQSALGIAVPLWSPRICLPLLSEDKRVLWVHANEVNVQTDKVAELESAFSRSPYLTRKQTNALAQRCSLHPDQVKVWFIAQRLRYGISWDYKDIREIWNKLNSNRKDEEGDEEFQDLVKDDQVKSKKTSLMERKVNWNMEQERPTEKETGRRAMENEAATPEKLRRQAVMSNRRRKRMKRDVEWITDQAEELGAKMDTSENEEQTSSTWGGAYVSKIKRRAHTKLISSPVKNAYENLLVEAEIPFVDFSSVVLQPQAQTSTAVPVTESQSDLQGRRMTSLKSSLEENADALACLEEALSSEPPKENSVVSEVDELKELVKAENNFLTASSPTAGNSQEEVLLAEGAVLRPRSRLKTQSQLLMLRRAFLEFQYPDAEQYSMLTRLVGIQRHHLVQWFGDRRYSIKKSKPRWMTEEQYNEILANIRYRQYKSILVKGLLEETE